MITRDSKRILVADDSEFFRVKLSDILTEAGHKVEVVRDGRELIDRLKRNSDDVDLLLMDLQMPEMDGFGALEWMGNNGLRDKFPVLAITGAYEPTEIIDELKDLGARGLMTKAFSPEQIVHRINRLLFPGKVARGATRIPISIPIDFFVDGSSYTGYLLNISATGLFLHAKQELKSGTELRVKFSLPDSDAVIEVTGTVKWCTHLSGEESLFGGAGIHFMDVKEGDQEELKKFVKAELEKLGSQE
jgi:uncharacterized protein (TIGR02266 family)